MQLVKIQITNFRSVENSGEFTADSVLCLVGKNEAGKTAILQALAGLNPHPATPIAFDKERDYPRRHLTEYVKRHPKEEAIVVRTWWQIAEEQRSKLKEQLGTNALKDEPVLVLRRYGADSPEWELPINFAAVVEHLMADERLTATEKKQLGEPGNSDQLRGALGRVDKVPDPQAC